MSVAEQNAYIEALAAERGIECGLSFLGRSIPDDVDVIGYGGTFSTIISAKVMSERALDWVTENCDIDPLFGDDRQFCGDHRPINNILQAMHDSGLVVMWINTDRPEG